jgi:hypothetical protein
VAEDELLVRLREAFKPQAGQNNFSPDYRVAPAVGILTEAVIRLDKTSRRLSIVNIVLTVVLGVIGGIQIWLMVRGH